MNFKVFKGQPNLTPASISEGSMPLLDLETKFKREKRKQEKQSADKQGKRKKENSSAAEDSDDDADMLTRTKKKRVHWENMESSGGNMDLINLVPEGIDKQKKKKKVIITEAEKTAQQLKSAAKAAPPTPPSSSLYTFFNCRNELHCIDMAPNLSAYSNRGPIIAAGFADSSIKCWNWDTTTVPAQVSLDYRNDDDDDSEGDSGDFASTKGLHTKQNGSAVDGHHQQQHAVGKNNNVAYQTLIGHSGPVYGLSFSSNQRWLLSCSEDCTTRLWNVETASNIVVYKGHQYPIWDVTFSKIDYLFATASHDRTARIWSTDRISPVRVLAGHLSDVETVRFHPNSNYIATGSSDKTVRLWDVNSGECVRMFIGHSSGVNCLAFSNDGRYLASAGEDKNVFVWDLATAKSVYQFKNYHAEQVWSLDFNHEGNMLASGSADCSVKVWHINRAFLEQQERELLKQEKGLVRGSGGANADQNANQAALMKTYYTKQTPVYKVKFSERDVLLAAGPFEF